MKKGKIILLVVVAFLAIGVISGLIHNLTGTTPEPLSLIHIYAVPRSPALKSPDCTPTPVRSTCKGMVTALIGDK